MITQPRVRRYAIEAAVKFDTSTRTMFTASMMRRDVAARWWVWRRLRADGVTYSTIARWTGFDRSVVRKAITRRRFVGQDVVSEEAQHVAAG